MTLAQRGGRLGASPIAWEQFLYSPTRERNGRRARASDSVAGAADAMFADPSGWNISTARRLSLLVPAKRERRCFEAHHRQARGPLRQRLPYLTVNTKFWGVDSLREDVWHTVFRTVHAGDEVKAYDADWPDRDDKIDSDTVGAEPAPATSSRTADPGVQLAPANRARHPTVSRTQDSRKGER
jgi:hypothetical protein